MIGKGRISAVKGDKAEVIPAQAGNTVTPLLTIPDMLRGNLQVNTEVVYVVFGDNTGIVLERMDGKNTHKHNYTHGGTASGDDTTSEPVK